MARPEPPEVPGVLTAAQAGATGAAIARMQEPSGQIPWFPGGHTDPWDHVESAMGLTVAGLQGEAEAAYAWSAATQRRDGSWPMRVRGRRVEDAATDINFCAYIAVGVWHHLQVTGDADFARRMWPTVRRALDLTVSMQAPGGEVWWARDVRGRPVREALLTGSSSIRLGLLCGIRLADALGVPQPGWESAWARLHHALRDRPESFTPKPEYSMDWYYPVLCGALRGDDARARIARRWKDFVVPGLGIRCVDHKPWVTGAETCELSLTLAAVGDTDGAREQLAAMQHLRDPDGSYWTGLVFADGKRWPVEVSSWTSAAVLLAADAIAGATGGARLFADAASTEPEGVHSPA
ncbi:prenyltransferase [Tomitella fengzijianii]|uniref:Prenyltransferase n=1 Tax=Tomitella fengzijianii TaxID=2597660 RepID=A0A516X6E8_9ACTN|nr:prenyltransferase [Tomitella fengzijianii]QDQ98636.1 prenyltransferase [Tomitella fengzijianii]